jgi:hypothetical protein
MSGYETSPVFEVFLRALLLAEKEGAREIGIDHLLAALDSPAIETNLSGASTEPFVPVPRVDKIFSSQAQAAITAAGDLDQLTVDSLRAVLHWPAC